MIGVDGDLLIIVSLPSDAHPVAPLWQHCRGVKDGDENPKTKATEAIM